MDFLTTVYLIFTFLALYSILIYYLTYFQNRKQMFEAPHPQKIYDLSIVIPCYNEQDSIGKTIEHHLQTNYEGLKKIYVVDDCSKDNSYNIIQKYAKKYKQVVALRTPKNTGKAAGAKNYGAKHVKTELIGFSDADSFPQKNAIEKMVGFFNDEKVGAVTSRVLVKNNKKYLEKAQGIEYKVIAFERKLLGFLDAIYVTNGPLSIYRKKAFDDVNGFDENNLTEDIEITWHFVGNGWKVHMALDAVVFTVVPNTVKAWFKQRVRWNVGGIQTIAKYKKTFFKHGMLGYFILPFFITGWVIGIVGMFFLIYRAYRNILVRSLTITKSATAEVALITFREVQLIPNVMWFFGGILLICGFIYTLTGLIHAGHKDAPRPSLLDIFIYAFFYLLMYPPLLIYSMYKSLRGYSSW